MPVPDLTIAEALNQVTRRLTAAGIDCARLDARLLVEAATGLTREQLVLEPGRELTPTQTARLGESARRRAQREPVTRILGARSFYGRTFEVTPDTLDPRPETETLVELALAIVRDEGWDTRPLDILDIGIGTGAILLTLLAELPTARGHAVDISRAALAVARRNALRLGVADRTQWSHIRDIDQISGSFDLVVSNPPYIPHADIADLDPEVRLHDPAIALDGGHDGLDIIRQIIVWSTSRTGTWFALEVGAGQSAPTIDLIGLHCGPQTAARTRVAKDLGGHNRVVAWKPHI